MEYRTFHHAQVMSYPFFYRLTVSYKFKTTIFHRNLGFRLTPKVQKKTGEIVCKLEPKIFRYVKTQLIPFLKQLVVFVSAMVANKNWIGANRVGCFFQPLIFCREGINGRRRWKRIGFS